MANPYLVTPGNNFGQGLRSLAGAVSDFGQQRKEQQRYDENQARMEEGKQALTAAIQSGDPMKVQEVSIQYPELSQAAKNAFWHNQ